MACTLDPPSSHASVGAGGCLLFTANLFFLRALGVTDAARDPEGRFKSLSVKSFVGFGSMLVNLYDFVVLDYLVIVRWHPAFLELPDTDYYTTTRPHAEGFVRGMVIGLPATLASAGLANVLARLT